MRYRRSESRTARAGRLRARRDTAHHRGAESDRLSDPAEGTRDRLSSRQPTPVAAQQPPARSVRDSQRGRAGDPRFFLRARISSRGHADPHRRDWRTERAILHGILRRRPRVPRADGTALRRSGGGGIREDLHLWPDISRREVEDSSSPHRVLDDRTGSGVERFERQHATSGGLCLLPRRALPRTPIRRARGDRARHGAARACETAVPPRGVRASHRNPTEEGQRHHLGAGPRRRRRIAARR